MTEMSQFKDALGSLLSTQMRFNLAATKLLGKLIGNDKIDPDDVDKLMEYLQLAIERSEYLIQLMEPVSDDG